ncbi:MAG: HIT family protein [Lachnospiraceae bacterium]|nr:HIT family protein [Lachnospiraceae bacterium]
MKKEDCIFCKIAGGEIPSKTLYEDGQFRVILDLAPAAKGHALVIPKEHYANLYEIPQETAAGVMKLAKTMAEKMTEKLGADGFNLLQNNGEAAGQSVMHFHMHLIPRYKGDGQQLFHEQPTASQDELEEIKRQITE